MSLSNPKADVVSSPVKKWYTWAGKEGAVRNYNSETKENEDLKTFSFVVLDVVNQIQGYNPDKGNLYSNYFRKTSEEITVKFANGGTITKGTYKEDNVKNAIKANGGKFGIVIFGSVKGETIGLKLKGSAMSAWFDYCQDVRINDNPVVKIASFKEESTSSGIEYRVPVFEKLSNPTDLQPFIEQDKVVQNWLNSKTIEKKEVEQVEELGENDFPKMEQPKTEVNDDLPF